MRDHGGNLDEARSRFGGDDWIDLSTGINRHPYPVGAVPQRAWTDLPTATDMADLLEAAQTAYGTQAPGLAMTGAQAVIQAVPMLSPRSHARVLAPTYNEHAATLRAFGWTVDEVETPDDLIGADLAVIVNPNNPDGRALPPREVLVLADRVGRLIVDESFADPTPELSVAPRANRPGLLVMRSFGKFFGLAGLRLGFAFANSATIHQLEQIAGPWPVSGAAIALGRRALCDSAWIAETTARLDRDAARLDARAEAAGWQTVGGTTLFRLYETGDAAAAQDHLASHRIWSRRFPYSAGWLRLGLPGAAAEWDRLATALEPPGPA